MDTLHHHQNLENKTNKQTIKFNWLKNHKKYCKCNLFFQIKWIVTCKCKTCCICWIALFWTLVLVQIVQCLVSLWHMTTASINYWLKRNLIKTNIFLLIWNTKVPEHYSRKGYLLNSQYMINPGSLLWLNLWFRAKILPFMKRYLVQ